MEKSTERFVFYIYMKILLEQTSTAAYLETFLALCTFDLHDRYSPISKSMPDYLQWVNQTEWAHKSIHAWITLVQKRTPALLRVKREQVATDRQPVVSQSQMDKISPFDGTFWAPLNCSHFPVVQEKLSSDTRQFEPKNPTG